jgi:hypothetical protein
MLTVNVKGGLGNQLFQIAAGQTISTNTGRTFYIANSMSPRTHHSPQNYMDTIFRTYKRYLLNVSPTVQIEEPSYEYRTWSLRGQRVCIDGYFQNYRYIPPTFASTLALPEDTEEMNGAFLHIRGGDYVNHPFHDVGLDSYYKRAIDLFPEGTHFFVFTNDEPYAKTKSFLTGISHSFVRTDDELVSLVRMSQCTLGGICANSTFSWWGAYLNRNRQLILPSKWFNASAMYVEGYFFPGSIVLEV